MRSIYQGFNNYRQTNNENLKHRQENVYFLLFIFIKVQNNNSAPWFNKIVSSDSQAYQILLNEDLYKKNSILPTQVFLQTLHGPYVSDVCSLLTTLMTLVCPLNVQNAKKNIKPTSVY